MTRFLLPLAEYNRIYQVAHGVLEDIANAERACIFFASFGALVLNKHYKIPARAVAGAFALCVSDRPEIAFFGKRDDDGALLSNSAGFHMWIQTQTHIVDFMAPIFPEAFANTLPGTVIPRKMLQKRLVDELPSAADLKAPGDTIGYPDPTLTQELIDNFFDRPANTDLLQIADAWFAGRRAKQTSSFAMQNDLGQVHRLTLPHSIATGSW